MSIEGKWGKGQTKRERQGGTTGGRGTERDNRGRGTERQEEDHQKEGY